MAKIFRIVGRNFSAWQLGRCPVSGCRSQPQRSLAIVDRQEWGSEAEGGGWMVLGWVGGAHITLPPYPEKLKSLNMVASKSS